MVRRPFFCYVIRTGYLFGRIKWNLTDLIVQLPYHVEHKKIKVLPCLCHPKSAFWIVQLFIFLASHSTRIHIFFKKINHWLNFFLKKKRGMAPTFGPTFFVTNRRVIIIIVAWPIMHRLLSFFKFDFPGVQSKIAYLLSTHLATTIWLHMAQTSAHIFHNFLGAKNPR